MPYVFLHISPVKHQELTKAIPFLRRELPGIIAEELSVNGGLTASEIMVWPSDSEKMFAVNGKPIEIIIFAHPFPERAQNVEERKESIIRRVREGLDEKGEYVSFGVCIMLVPMAYGESEVRPSSRDL